MNNKINKFTNHDKILKMTQLAILTALIFIMTFTPLGYFKVGIVDITFLMIPVAIGAIITGPIGGLFLGTMFGLSSFFTCFGFSAFGTALFGIDPLLTFITCLIPRMLMGYLVGLVFKGVQKIDKTKTVSFFVASLSGAVINTALFVLFLVLLFGNNADVLALFQTDTFVGIIVGLITVNALIEAGVSLVVGGSISKALAVYLPKLGNKAEN